MDTAAQTPEHLLSIIAMQRGTSYANILGKHSGLTLTLTCYNFGLAGCTTIIVILQTPVRQQGDWQL